MNSMIKIGFLLLSVTLATPGFATQYVSDPLVVIDPGKDSLKMLERSFPELIIDHVSSLGYEVYGPEGFDQLLTKLGLKFVAVDKSNEVSLIDYPSPEASIQRLIDLQKKYPSLITLMEIGKSGDGRSLVFAKLTGSNTRLKQNKPEFKYIANMHGDEIVGRELMIKLIEDLASNYGRDNRITRLMDAAQIYIMPSMNPDGASRKIRFNAKGVDLNRSFPDFTTTDNQNTWQNRAVEIQAIMKFQAQHHFKLSANFHGGAEVVNYPWDGQAALHPLDNLVKKLSLNYANRVTYLRASTEFKNGITNGYQWYEVKGGMQDWSYHWYNDLQVTIELTKTKWPSYSTIDQSYAANRDALLNYIEDMFQF